MRHGEDAPWLVNMFAITETAGELTFKRLLKSDADPANATNIGIPLSDVRLHLLDEQLDPVDEGTLCGGPMRRARLSWKP